MRFFFSHSGDTLPRFAILIALLSLLGLSTYLFFFDKTSSPSDATSLNAAPLPSEGLSLVAHSPTMRLSVNTPVPNQPVQTYVAASFQDSEGQTLSYTLNGSIPGLTLLGDTQSGQGIRTVFFSGTPTQIGTYTVTISAKSETDTITSPPITVDVLHNTLSLAGYDAANQERSSLTQPPFSFDALKEPPRFVRTNPTGTFIIGMSGTLYHWGDTTSTWNNPGWEEGTYVPLIPIGPDGLSAIDTGFPLVDFMPLRANHYGFALDVNGTLGLLLRLSGNLDTVGIHFLPYATFEPGTSFVGSPTHPALLTPSGSLWVLLTNDDHVQNAVTKRIDPPFETGELGWPVAFAPPTPWVQIGPDSHWLDASLAINGPGIVALDKNGQAFYVGPENGIVGIPEAKTLTPIGGDTRFKTLASQRSSDLFTGVRTDGAVVGCGETGNGILPLPSNPDSGYVSCDTPALVLSSLPAKDITMTNTHLFVLLENNSLIGMGQTLPVPTPLSTVPYSTLFPPTDLQPFNLPMIPLLR